MARCSPGPLPSSPEPFFWNCSPTTEPADWNVGALDSKPVLQNVAGGFATDTYDFNGTAGICLDDLVITEL
jgi:hypothetical protein